MKNTALPVILIVVGVAWLLRELGWLTHLHAVIPILLIAIGFVILLTEGINRSSVIAGPMLVFIGVAWLLNQQGMIAPNLVWPIGVVIFGILLFLARLPSIPESRRRGKRRNSD